MNTSPILSLQYLFLMAVTIAIVAGCKARKQPDSTAQSRNEINVTADQHRPKTIPWQRLGFYTQVQGKTYELAPDEDLKKFLTSEKGIVVSTFRERYRSDPSLVVDVRVALREDRSAKDFERFRKYSYLRAALVSSHQLFFDKRRNYGLYNVYAKLLRTQTVSPASDRLDDTAWRLFLNDSRSTNAKKSKAITVRNGVLNVRGKAKRLVDHEYHILYAGGVEVDGNVTVVAKRQHVVFIGTKMSIGKSTQDIAGKSVTITPADVKKAIVVETMAVVFQVLDPSQDDENRYELHFGAKIAQESQGKNSVITAFKTSGPDGLVENACRVYDWHDQQGSVYLLVIVQYDEFLHPDDIMGVRMIEIIPEGDSSAMCARGQ